MIIDIKLFFTNFYAGNYQPLTILFYAVEYKLAGGTALIYHLNNIILHLLNTYLVFILIKRISPQNIYVALITSAFFAVHALFFSPATPLHYLIYANADRPYLTEMVAGRGIEPREPGL